MYRVKKCKTQYITFWIKKLTGVAIVFGKDNPKAGGKYSVGNYN